WHESFRDPAFAAMARAAGAAIVFADSPVHPQFAEVTADFVYARLRDAREEEPCGYADAALDRWAATARTWAAGGRPTGFAAIDDVAPPKTPRDVFVFMINGAKVRAPAAAMALQTRLAA
ncbi:MAG TPA: DUF72 domain-containing protein, partial [Sphingomonadaceae bacterium]|nr:DUF72 domain-containing protein [Sphingomonadaceae bacterium]